MKLLLKIVAPLAVSLFLTGCVGTSANRCAKCCCCSGKPEAKSQAAGNSAQAKPAVLNIDFGPGVGSESRQSGPAAAGSEGDFWNCVSRGFNNHHTESGLRTADGQTSPIRVEMVNLGGGWGFGGKLGIKSPMLDDFNYPVNNQGGNSTVILHDVPPGNYTLLIYGHGVEPNYYGDYEVNVGGKNLGRKTTYGEDNAGQDTKWIEGRQYVRFTGVKVAAGDKIDILIRPGKTVSDGPRTFEDAMIAGLQLVPKSAH